MASNYRYTVYAAASQEALDNDGADAVSNQDTLAKAKARARYFISAEFALNTESGRRLGYARVVDEAGKNLFDIFGEGS